MKFHWFNLMPYPYLPEDFRQKHRSVWVDVDSRLYDPVKGHQIYNDYLDLLEFAAELGFDGVGVNEHHANAYGLMPSPAIMAATLARWPIPHRAPCYVIFPSRRWWPASSRYWWVSPVRR